MRMEGFEADVSLLPPDIDRNIVAPYKWMFASSAQVLAACVRVHVCMFICMHVMNVCVRMYGAWHAYLCCLFGHSVRTRWMLA